VLAPHFVAMVIQDLNEVSCLDVSTYGSDHGSLKLLPVVTQYFYTFYCMKSILIDLNSTPSEKSEMIANREL
jgi:hypothetical protein